MFLGPLTPMTILYDIREDGTWENMRILENNQELEDKTNAVKWPTREYGQYQRGNFYKRKHKQINWLYIIIVGVGSKQTEADLIDLTCRLSIAIFSSPFLVILSLI